MEEIMNRSESSVEITRNAKSNFQFSIKVYGDKLDETVKKAIEKADELNKKIPFQ